MKKFLAFVLAAVIALPIQSFGLTDELILTDPVKNTYTGRTEAASLIKNLNFTDLPTTHWAKEAVTRSGALNMVKGDAGTYKPNDKVTNEVALAFIMRVMGQEDAALKQAETLYKQEAGLEDPSTSETLWSLGYLTVARQKGLITTEQLDDATIPDQTQLDPKVSFMRRAPATREQVATWLYQAIVKLDKDAFKKNPAETRQKIFTFKDYQKIATDKIQAVEAITSAKIMGGDGTNFKPKDPLKRDEMAQILKNLDSIYFKLNGLEKRTATVGGVLDGQNTSTGEASVGRQFYLRASSGAIDVINYSVDVNSSPQTGTSDAVVYKNGNVGGLLTLAENDQVEYLIKPATNQVYYVQVVNNQLATKHIQGQLKNIDVAKGMITIQDAANKTYTYPMVAGIYGTDYAYISDKQRKIASLPYGSKVDLRLKNNIADVITYMGEPAVDIELRGIVIENNTDFGLLTFLDNDGVEISKTYLTNDIKVEKQPYYTEEDAVGYLDEIFPNFDYDPRDSFIEDIEPGDIIFVKLDPNNTDNITSISASTNYAMKYGKIKSISIDGDTASALIEYEDKLTSWYDFPSNIFVTKDGKEVPLQSVVAGDWAKFLVNQAIVAPGEVIETVKEVTVEGDEHFITNIIKGQVANIDTIQNTLVLQNTQNLEKNGWTDYKNISQFSLAGKDIEFYNNGQRVTFEYVNKYLKRTDGEVYVALENNFTGEKVKKVTFRTGRDELLPPDTILSADANGNFTIMGNSNAVSTDQGTIVRRYGRLVDHNSILPPDYAIVALNGADKAAIVDIDERPATSGVTVMRGRILSVDQGKSFKVQSFSLLNQTNDWSYTPVQREFAIDHNTLFVGGNGPTDMYKFIDYGDEAVKDKVYTIVVEGSRAVRVVEAPYPQYNSVRGTVYQNTGGSLSIKDAEFYTDKTGRWNIISNKNPILNVSTGVNSIIIRQNKLVTGNDVKVGDLINVMIAPSTTTTPKPGDTVSGTIVRVDR